MLTNELVRRLEDKVLEAYQRAQEVYGRAFEIANIEWRDMGRTAGRAYYGENKVVYSPTLYAQNVETFLARTCPHEVAHLVTNKLFPFAKQAHGPEWRGVMKALGVQDITRCHSYDTSSTARARYQTRVFNYACACREMKISARRHGRIVRGEANYTCNYCRQRIKPLGA